MKLIKSRVVKQFVGRDIIWVRTAKRKQPFYRSSGRNSGKSGVWLPFDGLHFTGWFIKDRYCNGLDYRLHRYGTPELKEISDELAKLDIPAGKEMPRKAINKFLNIPVS